jgi:hypothetical protein
MRNDAGGEGSRGGVVVGHTSGGVPVYKSKRSSHQVKTHEDLRHFADVSLPKDTSKWHHFYHSPRHHSELEAIVKQGVHPGSAGKAWLSKDEIRSRDAGFVVVRVSAGTAKEGVDYVEPGLSFREFTVDKPIPPEHIVKVVKFIQYAGGGGHGIDEHDLAKFAHANQGHEDLKELPKEYHRWFDLKRTEGK